MPTYKVDNQGRVMIPSKWRMEHGVKPGADLTISEEPDGRLSIQTYDQSVRRAQEMVRALVPPGVSLVDELLRERRREVAREERKSRKQIKQRGIVLDSSAVLAVLQHEPGEHMVMPVLRDAGVSSVNVVEVIRVLMRHGATRVYAERILFALRLRLVPFSAEDAGEAAEIGYSEPYLSLGDCACIALARREMAEVVTADRA